MKKIICAIFVLLAISLPAHASERVNIFPCSIDIYTQNKSIHFAPHEVTVINYGGHAYVPLRVLSEAMGAQVEFEAADGDGGINQITVQAEFSRPVKPKVETYTGETAIIYPSCISFTRCGYTTRLCSDKCTILNYNNRTYIPIRLFAESMGNYVDFQSYEGGENHIKIYDLCHMEPYIQNKDVSLYVTGTDNGDRCLIYTGLIRFDGDVSGKRISCTSGAFIIKDELTQPIGQGQIRKFTASISDEETAFDIEVCPAWEGPSSFRGRLIGGAGEDITLYFLIPKSHLNIKDPYYCPNDMINIRNHTGKNIILKAPELTYNMYKIDGENRTSVFSYAVPMFEGGKIDLQPSTLVKLTLPQWDFLNADGELCGQGKYEIELCFPPQLEYTVDGKPMLQAMSNYNDYTIVYKLEIDE